ncbi:MAG: hypothetical protein AAFN93_27870 [Bacteroidota bacterium]
MLYLIYSLSEKKYKLVKTALKFFDSPSTEVLYAFEEKELSVARKVMSRLNQQRTLSLGF